MQTYVYYIRHVQEIRQISVRLSYNRQMPDMGKLLQRLRRENGFKQAEFAQELGITPDVLSNIERGRTALTRDLRRKAAVVLKIDEALFRMETVNLGREVPVARTGYLMIPIYGAITAGKPGYTLTDVIDWEEMPDWGGDFERWGRIITGESMLPEFEEGDIAIFENRRFEPNHAVHAFCNGEDTFKVYREMPAGPELWPINEAYDPFSAKDWNVKGVCIRRIQKKERGIRDIREYPHGLIWRFR